MKLRKLAVLSVFVSCFTLFIFGLQVNIPDPNTGDEVLDSKIEEIMSMLNMYREFDLENQTVSYFQKLLTSNKLVFKKAVRKQGKKSHPLIEEQIDTVEEIIAYWVGLRGIGQFDFDSASAVINQIANPANIGDFEIDKEAVVTIQYSHNPSEGEISFTLYHMKRCIWD